MANLTNEQIEQLLSLLASAGIDRTIVGKVMPLHKGEYDPLVIYAINDIVSYHGSSYWKYNPVEEAGIIPVDETVWRQLTDASAVEEYVERAVLAANRAETAQTGAETAQAAAEDAEEGAQAAQTAAEAAQTAAENASETAQGYAGDASASASGAAQSAQDAENAATGAQASATTASNAAVSASASAADATSSATDAYTSQQAAEAAQEAAETAEAGAESAVTDAVAAKDAAVAAKTAAETAKTDAIAAKTAAETAQAGAESAEDGAEAAQAAAEAAAALVADMALMEAIAPKYSSTAVYKIGNLLSYQGKQYYCIADAPAGTLPTNTAYFEEKSVADIVEMIKQGAIVTGHSQVADNLTPYSEDSGTTQENPFISQGTGTDNNSVIVTTGNIARQLEKQGNTVPVIQFVNWENIQTFTHAGITFTNNNDGSFTLNGTATSTAVCTLKSGIGPILTAGHKYFVYGQTDDADCYIQGYDDGVGEFCKENYHIFTYPNVGSASTNRIRIRVAEGTTLTNKKIYVPIFDITSWNSSIITDLTANPSNFSWYYNGSLAYDAGSLQNCNGRYLECGQGRNLFAGNSTSSAQYIGHYYINSSFEKIENNSYNCYRVMVVPNTQYFMGRDDNNWLSTAGVKRFVDNNLNLISGDHTGESAKYGIFTTPANCRYIEFCTSTNTNYNIDLELYYTPEQGGEGYLNSSGAAIHYDYIAPIRIDTGNETHKAFDRKLPSGVIERATEDIDLTTLTFTLHPSIPNWFYASLAGHARPDGSQLGVCNIYVTSSNPNFGQIGDYEIAFDGVESNGRIIIKDPSCADATALMTKLTNLNATAQYKKLNTTTEQGTPYSEYADINDYSYMCWLDSDGNLVSIPQGCKLFYPVDYKGWIDDAVMYTNGDVTSLAKNESITDSALNARGYYKMQDLLTTFGANGMVGGTLRNLLVSSKNVAFDKVNVRTMENFGWTKVGNYGAATGVYVGYIEGKSFTSAEIANALSTIYPVVANDTLYSGVDKCMSIVTPSGSQYCTVRINDTSIATVDALRAILQYHLLAFETN